MSEIFFKTFKNDWYSNIYALGDIHGDIMPLIICLRDCCQVIKKKFAFDQNKEDIKLIKELSKEYNDVSYKDDLNYEWCGEDSYIVLCGDILDNARGNIQNKPQEFPFEEAKIFKFINAINKQAMMKNGRIFKVLGNHDMYNLNGNVKTHYSSYVSEYAKNYNGYKVGAEGRLDYFGKGKPGAKLIGEDGAYLFLMIRDFIFVHGGISSSLVTVKNIETINESLMKYIYDSRENMFDSETKSIENLLTFSNEDNDGLVFDRYFGFKQEDVSESDMCSSLYNKFKSLCREIINKYDKIDIKKTKKHFTTSNHPICDPNTMKLVIGHCNQNQVTNENNQIYKSSYNRIIKKNVKEGMCFSKEFGGPVYSGDQSSTEGIYGITVSCGNRNKDNVIDYNNPSIFRLDVAMSRAFNIGRTDNKYIYSRTPQVLKIDYKNRSSPKTSIIKSTLKNTLTHLKGLIDTPIYSIIKNEDIHIYNKYLKYKIKYEKLKKMIKKSKKIRKI